MVKPDTKQAHLGIWDLRRREALIVNRSIFEFRGPRCPTDPSKLLGVREKMEMTFLTLTLTL